MKRNLPRTNGRTITTRNGKPSRSDLLGCPEICERRQTCDQRLTKTYPQVIPTHTVANLTGGARVSSNVRFLCATSFRPAAGKVRFTFLYKQETKHGKEALCGWSSVLYVGRRTSRGLLPSRSR